MLKNKNNRSDGKTFLKMENGNIIESNEEIKKNLNDVRTEKDIEIKQKKYKRISNQNPQMDDDFVVKPDGTVKKKKRKENPNNKEHRIGNILIKLALVCILIPIIIFLVIYIKNINNKTIDSIENLKENTVQTTDNRYINNTKETTKETEKQIETESLKNEDKNINDSKDNSIIIKGDSKIDEITLSYCLLIDKYNDDIFSAFTSVKEIANQVLEKYGDTFIAESDFITLEENLLKKYNAFRADKELQENFPNVYTVLNKRYVNVIDLTTSLKNNVNYNTLSSIINTSIESNNNYMIEEINTIENHLKENNIKYTRIDNQIVLK